MDEIDQFKVNEQATNIQQQPQQEQKQPNQQPPYSIPGVLHYLKYEWHRFEVDRQEWEVEKAELTARIALLQGEKKSNENLKHDLIRRIKMLEHCLREERERYHQLEHGIKPDGDVSQKAQNENFPVNNMDDDVPDIYRRDHLKQYLQEISCTDTIIDARTNRVRSLSGFLNFDNNNQEQEQQRERQLMQQVSDQLNLPDDQYLQLQQQQKLLQQQLEQQHQREQPENHQPQQPQPQQQQQQSQPPPQQQQTQPQQKQEQQQDIQITNLIRSTNINTSHNESSDGFDAVDLGELAALITLGSETNVGDHRKKQWVNKYHLQSHFDCVRALKFSETDSLLVTASEDETIKLWHLARTSTGGKSKQPSLPQSMNAIGSLEASTLDIEPIHTYRGHTSKILAITIHKNRIFSGAVNGEIIMWKIISVSSSTDQYDKFDSSLLICKFIGHEDAVWSLEILEQPNSEPVLCSASADSTIKIWNTGFEGDNITPIKEISLDSSPTCIAKMPLYNTYQPGADIAVSCDDGKIRLYDITKFLNSAESNTQPTAILSDGTYRINSIVIHPTLPYLASADSHHKIKFWDLNTHQCKLTMVAHLDEITSLACDPTGKYLLSASHDCSARLWLFEERACIQEITSHRKKFGEGILAVAFHPSLSHFATAGADGLAKVFV